MILVSMVLDIRRSLQSAGDGEVLHYATGCRKKSCAPLITPRRRLADRGTRDEAAYPTWGSACRSLLNRRAHIEFRPGNSRAARGSRKSPAHARTHYSTPVPVDR